MVRFGKLLDDIMMRESNEFEEKSEDALNDNKDKEDAPAYKLQQCEKLKEGEVPLSNVVGHVEQKKELLLVVDWFKRSKELREKGVSIPKGVILFGEPGNGKSLLIKEIIRCTDAPAFVFQGEQTNIVKGIIETFKKAREAKQAIIVIDELDLLIARESRVSRSLQECLDGVESNDDILVLAATNNLDDIPSPLLRHGRLEKLIHIPYPKGSEALELLKKHFKEFNLELPENFDDEEVALSLNGITCAGIKSLVNDIVLRNGFTNITMEMIDNSIYNITDRIKKTTEKYNLDVAIHEAGHAVMARAFPQYFLVNRLNISGSSGSFHAKEVERGFWPYKKIIADIKISMAGVIAQKLICGEGSRGAEDDLQNARIEAYNMINMNGYSSCYETLPTISRDTRSDTQIKRRKMERKIERLLKRCEKETIKYIKANRRKVEDLGHLLYKKKHLKSSEILALIG